MKINIRPSILSAYCPPEASCDRIPLTAVTLLATQIDTFTSGSSLNRISLTTVLSATSYAPQIIFTHSEIIGICDDLVVDFSSSSGSGGRKWRNISISVDGTAPNISSVKELLNNFQNLQLGRFSIPNKHLNTGYVYSFTVFLCNMLGNCGQGASRIGVSVSRIPVVTIAGSQVRTVVRNDEFQLVGSAYVSGCDTSKSSSGLIYHWAVYDTTSKRYLSVISKSVNKLIFRAAPFTFEAGILYSISLTAVESNSQLSSSSVVSVIVDRADLVAVISGGSTQSFPAGEKFSIDATRSYDANAAPGEVVVLEYEWVCTDVNLQRFTGCPFIINGSSNEGILKLTSRADQVSDLAKLVVIVSDKTGRSASSSINVIITATKSSIVTLISSQSVINPSTKLVLSGSVSSSNAGIATWSIDNDVVDLSAIASAVETNLTVSMLQDIVTLTLAVPQNSLISGESYIFSLSFISNSDDITVSASVIILVNSVPQGGIIVSDPSIGNMLTSFALSTLHWRDNALPLVYDFSYSVDLNSYYVTQSKSESKHAAVVLPRGSSGRQNLVSIRVRVFNALGASNMALTDVTVTAAAGLNVSAIVARIYSGINTNDLQVAVALSTSILNYADCSQAPDCLALNRGYCSVVENTCGPCLSGFDGSDIFGNTECYSNDEYRRRNLIIANDATSSNCNTSSHCLIFSTCKDNICVPKLKDCISNCSGRGKCVYQLVGGASVDVCYAGDSRCFAVCNCSTTNFYGYTCSLTKAGLAQRQQDRSTIIDGVANIIANQDADAESVRSWTDNILSVVARADELDKASRSQIVNSAVGILEASINSNISHVNTDSLLDAVRSFIYTAQDEANATKRAALNANLVNQLQTLFSRSVASSQVAGESIFSVKTPVFSISTVHSSTTSEPGTTITTPLTVFEKSRNLSPNIVGTSRPGEQFSVTSTVSSLFSNNLFRSDVIGILFEKSTCNPGNQACLVELIIQNNAPINYTVMSKNETIFCGIQNSTTSIQCPGGEQVVIECNGSWVGQVNIKCPIHRRQPNCNTVSGIVGVSAGQVSCAVSKFSAYETHCVCDIREELIVLSSTRRKLSNIVNTSSQTVQFVTMLSFTVENFENTWVSAQDLNKASVEQSILVLVTTCLVCFCALFGGIAGSIADRRASAQILSDEHTRSQSSKDRDHIASDADIDAVLPDIYLQRPLTQKVVSELKVFHRYFGIFFHYSSQLSRPFRVLCLVTGANIMLFANAVVYNIAYPDDGSCQQLDTASLCLDPQSSFSSASKCYWDYSTNHCSFREPADSLKQIVFVAVISAIVSAPLSVFIDYLIMSVLAVPTQESRHNIHRTDVEPSSLKQSDSIIHRRAALSTQCLPTSLPEDLITFERSLMQFRGHLESSTSASNVRGAPLSDEEVVTRQMFDDMWGILPNGNFMSKSSNSIFSIEFCCNKILNIEAVDVKNAIEHDLQRVRNKVELKNANFKKLTASAERGRRMVYLFTRDLLSDVDAMVLDSKSSRGSFADASDNFVSFKLKLVVECFVGCLNVGLLFYVFLFAVQQSASRQKAWFQTFIIWLCLEVFVVSTVVVCINNVAIPMVINDDIQKVKRRLQKTINGYKNFLVSPQPIANAWADQSTSSFNYAEGFFVSYRLAKLYPDLAESRLVLTFSSPWPRQSYKTGRSLSKHYSHKSSAIVRSLSMIVVFLIKGALILPPSLQDLFTKLTIIVAFCYLIPPAAYLYQISPILPFVPVAIIIGILVVILCINNGKASSVASAETVSTDIEVGADQRAFNAVIPIDGRHGGIGIHASSSSGGVNLMTRKQSIQAGVDLSRRLEDTNSKAVHTNKVGDGGQILEIEDNVVLFYVGTVDADTSEDMYSQSVRNPNKAISSPDPSGSVANTVDSAFNTGGNRSNNGSSVSDNIKDEMVPITNKPAVVSVQSAISSASTSKSVWDISDASDEGDDSGNKPPVQVAPASKATVFVSPRADSHVPREVNSKLLRSAFNISDDDDDQGTSLSNRPVQIPIGKPPLVATKSLYTPVESIPVANAKSIWDISSDED